MQHIYEALKCPFLVLFVYKIRQGILEIQGVKLLDYFCLSLLPSLQINHILTITGLSLLLTRSSCKKLSDTINYCIIQTSDFASKTFSNFFNAITFYQSMYQSFYLCFVMLITSFDMDVVSTKTVTELVVNVLLIGQ